jgi:hypothetical protein
MTNNTTVDLTKSDQSLLINITNVTLLILGTIAVIGNGFILLVVGRYKKLRADLCNLFISILAIADFGSGELCYVFVLVHLKNKWLLRFCYFF